MAIPASPCPPPDADPPVAGVSAAFIRALAAHPQDMADLMDALHRRVVDEDSLLDLTGSASREAVQLLEDAHWTGVTAQFAGIPVTAAHDRRYELSAPATTDLLHQQAAEQRRSAHQVAEAVVTDTVGRVDPTDPAA